MVDLKHASPARYVLSFLLAAWIALVLSTTPSYAQAGDPEEVVVTGTRKAGLEPTETLSPVDVLSDEALLDQASFDLTEGLSRIAPSFNTQRFPIADGTAFVRPVTLRNLSPDHTLVLVNGSRRHRSALVNLQLAPLGTVNQGSQGPDFSMFPAAAIERVEVLRDGASAQYGSDAIAGVVNVILKDDPSGGSFYVQAGEYYEGDGGRLTMGGNGGIALGPQGFLNAAFERSTSDRTSRGMARPDAMAVADVVGADRTPLNGLGQRWGDPDVDITKVFANVGYEFSEQFSLYTHGSYAENEVISDFFYRTPVLDPAAGVAARSTLMVDADGDFIPDPAPQSLVDDIVAAGLNPDDYITADASSPSGYVLLNPAYARFPGGYNPNFGADITDYAWVYGAKGRTAGDLSWDVSGRLAENKVEYRISETINPSLGRLSPDAFKPGNLIQQELAFNAQVVKPFDTGSLYSPLNVAVGLEYRKETYDIEAGDPRSIEFGPTAAFFGLGSDGFQGFPIESAGSFEDESFAGYADLEADLTDRLAAGLAGRYEDYDTFGDTFDWKASTRFRITEELAARGTFNTGFRAPTPGQVNTLNVTTSADASGNLIPSGTYPVSHPVALALGAVPLTPEESTSFTLGVVSNQVQRTSITLDFYYIEIKDRLAFLNNTIEASDVPALEDQGVENADLLVGSLANFLTNAFKSKVTGVDLAITSGIPVNPGLLTLDFRFNWNDQKVSDVVPGTINESRVFDLENQVPNYRSALTVGYDTQEMFSGFVRGNLYGKWKSSDGLFDDEGDADPVTSYGSKVLVDAEVKATFQNHYDVAIGGENIFDTLPDEEGSGVLQFLGVTESLTSPFGFNGGFWYVRAAARF